MATLAATFRGRGTIMSKTWMMVVPMLLVAGLAQAAGKRAAAAAEPAAEPAAKAEASAEYQPKTKFDNTPYRFNMEQNGKRMSAEEFDAWMKSRGIRVAKGAPAPAATATAAKEEKKD
jgi:hypothetical protein